MKKCGFRRLIPLFLGLVLVFALTTPALAQTTTVEIPDTDAYAGQTKVVAISINDVTDLGAVDIWLQYDETVVEVTNVADGDLGPLTGVNIDNPNGVTKMNWFSTEEQTGSFVFANVSLHAVGNPGDTSPLDIVVEELGTSEGALIENEDVDGTFTILIEETYTLEVIVTPAGSGSVSKDPDMTNYPDGEVVTLTATAASGWDFDEWSGDASGFNEITQVTMNADKSVTAHFVEEPPLPTPGPGAVGGIASTPNKLGVLAPWILLAVMLLAVGGWFTVRRHGSKA